MFEVSKISMKRPNWSSAVLTTGLALLFAGATLNSASAGPLVEDGQSLEYYAPHHTPGDAFHEEHYFLMTGDLDHFGWFSANTIKFQMPVNRFGNRGRG